MVFVGCGLVFGVCRCLFLCVCGLVFVVCRSLLFGVRCSVCVVFCVLSDVRCLRLFVVGWLVDAVC